MRTIVALMLLSTAALAADEPRLINFTAALQLPDGGDMLECTKQTEPEPGKEANFQPICTERKPITLGMVVYRALLKTKQNQSLNDAAARWRLSRRVLAGPAKLSSADVSLLVNAVHDFGGFSTEVEGQSICLLDPVYCDQEK